MHDLYNQCPTASVHLNVCSNLLSDKLSCLSYVIAVVPVKMFACMDCPILSGFHSVGGWGREEEIKRERGGACIFICTTVYVVM